MTVRVMVGGAGDIVTAGLQSLLESSVLEFVDCAAPQPDVIIYDVIGMQADGGQELWDHIASGVPVIAIGRPLRPDLAARAVAHGAVVTLPTEATGEELLAAVVAAAAGDAMPVGLSEVRDLAATPDHGNLTPREVDVLRCIAAGLSNAEICRELAITNNTVKTYIRLAYRKIGVKTRAQAMSWCLQHGFDPEGFDQAGSERG